MTITVPQLQAVQTVARHKAEVRLHKLGTWRRITPKQSENACVNCQLPVFVDLEQPLSEQISGRAVVGAYGQLEYCKPLPVEKAPAEALP